MKFNSDIDIDFGDRDKVLSIIEHIPAAMRKVNPIRKHATGIHVTSIPYDPVNNMASIDYAEAEKRGYKLELSKDFASGMVFKFLPFLNYRNLGD